MARAIGDKRLIRLVLGPAITELAIERDDSHTVYPGPFATVAGTKWTPVLPSAHILRRAVGAVPSDSTVLVREVHSRRAVEHVEVDEAHTLLPSNTRVINFVRNFIRSRLPEQAPAGKPPGSGEEKPMAVRKLPKPPTLGGKVFWRDVANEGGWRVQYNKTLDSVSPLKPYRLLDPEDYLCASADSAEEMAAALPSLMAEYSKKKPLVTKEEVIEMAKNIAMALIQAAATKGRGGGGGGARRPARRR